MQGLFCLIYEWVVGFFACINKLLGPKYLFIVRGLLGLGLERRINMSKSL